MSTIVLGLIAGSLFFNFSLISIIIVLTFLFKNYKSKNKIILFASMFLYCIFVMLLTSHTNNISINKTMIVVQVKDNYVIVKDIFRKYYLSAKNNGYEVGDLIKIKGDICKIKMHAIESHFDFEKYLENNGIYFEIITSETNIIFKSFFSRRELIEKHISGYNDQSKELIKSIVFGMSRGDNLKEYSNTSLAYFLSLNNYLLTTLFFGINKIISKKYKKSESISLLILSPYIVFIFDKTCFFRLIIYLLIFRYIRNKYQLSINNCILLTIVIYLFVSPFNIFNEGLVIPLILSVVFRIIRNFKINKLFKTLLLIMTIYLLSIVKNNTIMILSPLYRVLLLPVIFVFFIFALLFIPLGIGTQIIDSLSSVLFRTFDFISSVDICIYLHPNFISVIIMLFLFLIVLVSCYIRHKKMLKKAIGTLLLATIILTSNIHTFIFDYLCFIDVGQGDCALLIHNNKSLLIDTGGLLYEDLAQSTLIPFFKRYHLKKIDAIICSHSDYDHIGALKSLKENFRVETIIDDRKLFPYDFYGIKIDNLNNYHGKDENDNSLINIFNFMNKTILFMGDASSTIEEKIVKDYDLASVDILKVSHHGSKTATSEALLKEVSPCVAIISVGFNNIYNFPSDEVMDRLQKYQIEIRRTDVEGTIIYKKISF